jgi:ribose transport system permease protein
MSGILLLLVGIFSALTVRDQSSSGAGAVEPVFAQLRRLSPSGPVLIAVRPSDEGRNFAQSLEKRLKESGFQNTRLVVGEPRDVKQALRLLASESVKPGAVATTGDDRNWPPLQDLSSVGNPPLVTPPLGRWPVFLTSQNLWNIANQIVVVATLSAGLTVVILTGGIDLSGGSLIALAAVLAGRWVRDYQGGVGATVLSLLVSAVGAIAVCGAVGFVSGAVIVRFGLPPFIATLAVMQSASGLAFILSRGESIYDLPESATLLGRGFGPFGIPYAIGLLVLVYGFTHLLLAHSRLGRYVYAVGGNEIAARLSGVPVGAVKRMAYLISGLLAGLGGIILTSQLKSAAPTYGLNYELYAIAAVVVGGASLNGGRGTILGTLVGALIIAVLQNGMNLTGVESYAQKLVLGLVILGAVLVDRIANPSGRNG